MSGSFGEKRDNTGKSVEWYTPKWIFDELGCDFDLDPSSPHDMESQVPAKEKYTIFDDGLQESGLAVFGSTLHMENKPHSG